MNYILRSTFSTFMHILKLVKKCKRVRTLAYKKLKQTLLGGESNPSLLCDRQGYSPPYYQGLVNIKDLNTT